jgi:SAM-dependent methyltransferase
MAGFLFYAWFDPFFLTKRALRRCVSDFSFSLRGLALDVGCGNQPYRNLLSATDYFGVEVPTASKFGSAKRADAYFDGSLLPFANGTFDIALCSQVLEHVFTPNEFLAEIHRVLKPGGHLLVTTPFIWDEHEQPFDFGRYSSFGLRHLAGQHGFVVEQATKTLADASALVQLTLAYLFKILRRLPAPLAKPLCASLSLPFNVLGLLVSVLLPANPDMYIDNVMLWRKSAAESSGDQECP